MTNLEIALQYAGRSWAVFPCHHIVWSPGPGGMAGRCSCGRECASPGKHPRVRGGLKAASRDPRQLEAWWGRWPDANIAIATGAASGLTVFDVDGAQGFQELGALLAGSDGAWTIPDTLAAQTGSGAHLYFQSSGESTSARGKLHVRGEGGYVIAPPSNHISGRNYQWLNARSPIPLPEKLKEYAQGADIEGERRGTRLAALGPIPDYLKGFQQDKNKIGETAATILRKLYGPADIEEVKSALQVLDPDMKMLEWVKIGMALHSLDWQRSDGTDIGRDLWEEWSATGKKFTGSHEIETRWRSFQGRARGAEVGLGTLFHMARKAGWIRERDTTNDNATNGDIPTSPVVAEESLTGAVSPIYQSPIPHNTPPVYIPPAAALNGHASLATAGALVPALPAQFTQRPIRWVDIDKNGNPKATCANTRVAIRRFGLDCRYDVFHDRFSIGGASIGEFAGELTDNAVHMLRSMIHQAHGWDPGTVGAYDAAIQECLTHRYDPVQDYLDGLRWDQQPRLQRWLSTYLGAEDTPLNHAFGVLTLTAAVRRTRQPGAKFDQIIVLEGPEGTNKSSAIELLAEAAGAGNYSDSTILTLDDRGQQEAVQGVWLYEIADLAGISKTEVERVKAFASRRVDRARPAYGRSRQDRPRRCVFFATTNHDTYLKSQTGDRRFWPVRTGHIDIERLRDDRDQLWAEAAAIERTGVGLGLPPQYWVDAAELQAARRDVDPWDDILMHVAGKEFEGPDGLEFRVSSRDLFQIHLPEERLVDTNSKRLSYCMKRLGWQGPMVFWSDGKAVRGYRKLANAQRR